MASPDDSFYARPTRRSRLADKILGLDLAGLRVVVQLHERSFGQALFVEQVRGALLAASRDKDLGDRIVFNVVGIEGDIAAFKMQGVASHEAPEVDARRV